MHFREATVADIDELTRVRFSVNENVLSNPALVTYAHYQTYLTQRGKGWVAETDGRIVGFAIADLEDHSIWALFVEPGWEGKGIGKQLQQLMLDWYFAQTTENVWLTTAPHSRAEGFYRRSGWQQTGVTRTGELRFELTYEDWQQHRA